MTTLMLRRAALATQSGIGRYSRELVSSAREAFVPPPQIDPAHDLSLFEGSDLAALFIGHSTVLLRAGGQTILTDPVFSQRIGMTIGGVTFGLKRVAPVPVDIDHLPHIDAVLLSHAHFDHLDRPSLRRLAEGPARGATVITARHTRRLVPHGFSDVVEIDWGGQFRLHGGLVIEALRPAHWGARTAYDKHRRFNSYVLNHPEARVLFAGDTAMTDAFDRVGACDLSIFGIGAYDPWEGAHATPEQVWTMYTRMSRGRAHGRLLPMHHSTFVLGREPLDEPLRRLRSIAREDEFRIVAPMPGDLWGTQR